MGVVGGSVQDELLRFSGSTNNFFETVTATGNGSAVYVGNDAVFQARAIVAGAVSGTTPTLDVKFQASADGSTSWTDIPGGAFTQITASSATATGSLAEEQAIIVRMPSNKGYARIVKTAGGTSPSFGSFAVLIDPVYSGTP